MKKSIAICQPHYLPWIGYFEMLDRVDLFVFLDDVDFIKREWKNRNRIRKDAQSEETKWLSVPIEHTDQRNTWIRDARIADTPWRERHVDGFRHVYRHTPHFDDAFSLLQEAVGHPAKTLAELNVHSIAQIARYLNIDTELALSSSIGCQGRKTDKLLATALELGASDYLANNGSADYLDEAAFVRAGIACMYQDYRHPSYVQRSGSTELPFLSHLSILDLIANHGGNALEVLRQGRPSHA